jgi:hypothetical protein
VIRNQERSLAEDGLERTRVVTASTRRLPGRLGLERLERGHHRPANNGETTVRTTRPRRPGDTGNAANPRQLEAMPSFTDNRVSQMEEVPRSNTANTKERTVVPLFETAKIAAKSSLFPGNAAS